MSVDHVKSSESLKQTCQAHVVEPMKNLNRIFPLVHTAIKKRENSYKELIKLQEKLDKAQEKERTGQNMARINELAQAVQQAKQQFSKENSFLMQELPNLYVSRIDYIKPCVSSLIHSQLGFYDSYSKFYETILSNNDESSGSGSGGGTDRLSSEQGLMVEEALVNDDIQKCLNDIKSLSIVSGD